MGNEDIKFSKEIGSLDPVGKASLAVEWAMAHVEDPCGETPEEREYMKKVHIKAVRGALAEPGVREALTEEQREILRKLGIEEGEEGKMVYSSYRNLQKN